MRDGEIGRTGGGNRKAVTNANSWMCMLISQGRSNKLECFHHPNVEIEQWIENVVREERSIPSPLFVGALREHHGTYRCRVTNAAGQAQHIGHLRVRSEPKLTIQPQQSTYFLARQPLSISCLVSGYPLAGTNLSSLQSASTDEAEVSTVSAVAVLESSGEETAANQQQLQQQKTNQILQEAERVSPVRLVVLKANRRREPLVSVKLTDLRVGVYEGCVVVQMLYDLDEFNKFSLRHQLPWLLPWLLWSLVLQESEIGIITVPVNLWLWFGLVLSSGLEYALSPF